MKSFLLPAIVFCCIFSTSVIAQPNHSVTVSGGFATTYSNSLVGTVVEGAYSYYFGNWSLTGQIGRADFAGERTTMISRPDFGVVNYVPADIVSMYRTADLLGGYSHSLHNSKVHLIARTGPSLARTAQYFINPTLTETDYDILDVGIASELGIGYTVISSGTATIDLNLKLSARQYFSVDEGYIRLAVGITCRLYDQ